MRDQPAPITRIGAIPPEPAHPAFSTVLTGLRSDMPPRWRPDVPNLSTPCPVEVLGSSGAIPHLLRGTQRTEALATEPHPDLLHCLDWPVWTGDVRRP